MRNTEYTSPEFCHWTLPPIDNDIEGSIVFTPPGEDEEQTLNGGTSYHPAKEWKWNWSGDNENTDCGLKIVKLNRYDSGYWSYTFGGSDVTGKLYIYVKAPPTSINFWRADGEVPDEGLDFVSGKVMFNLTRVSEERESYNASCRVEGARPLADVTWMINDEVLLWSFFGGREYEITNDESYNIIDTISYIPEVFFSSSKPVTHFNTPVHNF